MNREAIQNYLANPDFLNKESAVELKEMIGNYPYCSLLYLLLARAHQNANSGQLQEVIEKAAAYSPDREGLYLFLHAPGKSSAASKKVEVAETNAVPEEPVPGEPLAEESVAEEPLAEESVTEAPGGERPVAEKSVAEEPTAENPAEKPVTTLTEEASAPEPSPAESGISESAQTDAPADQAGKTDQAGESKSSGTSLARKPAGAQDIALNIDDQLPRTFTFWLRRIRQVTEGEPDYSVKITDVLETNYYQELITRKTEKEYLSSAPVKFDLDKKEDRIIARFIQEDPQVIKPTMTIQAKEPTGEPAGPEDDDEMISETLAQIYIDQDLTDKAIRVYEKLSLKFPEKSAYFAGLIEKLNK